MTEREETGIAKLDEILDGGIPAGGTVLVIGEPGTGKTTFCNQFMNAGLEQDEGGIYITLDHPPDEVVDAAEQFGWQLDDSDSFLLIDVYSWRLGEDLSGKYTVQGPSDLNKLNMALSDALNEVGDGTKRLVVDSASTLIFYTDPGLAVKFLQVVSAKSKASDGALLITAEESVHDQQVVSTLNYVADGVITLKQEDDSRYFRVERMMKTSHPSEWFEFEIGDSGIET